MIRPLACVLALLLAAPTLRAQDPKEEKGGTGDKLLDVKGKLTDDDPRDAVVKPSPCKIYRCRLKKGENYVIDMVSDEIDPFLRLVDPFGKEVARDDDSGGGYNARIRYRARETGVYQIVATSYPWKGKDKPSRTGNFTLTVRQPTEAEADPYYPMYGKLALEIAGTTLKGKAKKLSDLKGKVVLVDFWAVWCGPCLRTFPHLREWEKQYRKDGLRILGVTTLYGNTGFDKTTGQVKRLDQPLKQAEEMAMLKDFAAHHKLRHDLLVVPRRDYGAVSREYRADSIPMAVLIDRQGIVRLVRVGAQEENAVALEAAIKKLLAQK
jgi:thiol-disulfide isomerase/thioredoxin